MHVIRSIRAGVSVLNANRRRFFWAWIAYQSVKGAITLSVIWIPLLIAWLHF